VGRARGTWKRATRRSVPFTSANFSPVRIVAARDLPALRAHARARGWNRLRLLSCGSNSFKYDLRSEDQQGNQDSFLSKAATASFFTSIQPAPAMALFTTPWISRLTAAGRMICVAEIWHEPLRVGLAAPLLLTCRLWSARRPAPGSSPLALRRAPLRNTLRVVAGLYD
jgi:hypothetical protein